MFSILSALQRQGGMPMQPYTVNFSTLLACCLHPPCKRRKTYRLQPAKQEKKSILFVAFTIYKKVELIGECTKSLKELKNISFHSIFFAFYLEISKLLSTFASE